MHNTSFTKEKKFTKSKMFYFIYIPLIVIFVINLLIFGLSSFFDLQIMDFFSGGLKSRFLTLYSQFYHFAGYTELYIPFIVFLFFASEYVNRHIWKDTRTINNMRWVWFATVVLIWFGLFMFKFLGNFLSPYSTSIIIDGIIQSIDFNIGYFISSGDLKYIISLTLVYQLTFLLISLYILKKKIVDRPDFIKNKYWINAAELVIFFFISYVIVGSTKVLMGRDYYKSLNYVIEYRAQLLSELSGININDILVNTFDVNYLPWWVPNGLIGNPDKIWDILANRIGTLFTANAFPSGHMAATGMVGYMLFAFVFRNGSETKLNRLSIFLFWIFNLHLLLMFLSFLINGSHWATDLSFSWMWVIVSIALTQLISKKLHKRFERKNLQ